MKLLCLGDSLTYGYDVPLSQRWTTLVANQLGITIDNQGVCGDTTEGMQYRLQFLRLHAYDAFFLMGGSNDVLMDSPVDQTIGTLETMTQTLLQTGKPVFMGIPPLMTDDSARFGWQRAADVKRHNEMLQAIARAVTAWAKPHGCAVIPFATVVSTAVERQLGQVLYADGVHPNAAGYERFAALASSIFRQVLGL